MFRRVLVAVAAVGLLLVGAVVIVAVAVDTGHLRAPVLKYFTAHTGRSVEVKGAFKARLLSMHPAFEAERVEIGNPPWMPPGLTLEAGRLSVILHLPWIGRALSIDRLEIKAATLHLMRDPKGRANWQWRDPGVREQHRTPLIHSLAIADARVLLDDERRHLKFDGRVTAADVAGAGSRLKIVGTGRLNDRPATFDIDGDALAAVAQDTPYHFAFREESSGSRIVGSGNLPHPFDFGVLDARFDAEGADLKDLYYLAGINLVNTGSYHLSGKIGRRGARTLFSDLIAKTGSSDMHGSVNIDSSGERPKLEMNLESQFLRLADLGARAAGREPAVDGPRLLLSNVTFKPKSLRRSDAVVSFHAQRMQVGRVDLTAVAARMNIEAGIAVVTPMTADMMQGNLSGHVRVDATTDLPHTDFDLKLTNVEIGQWPRKDGKATPVEGKLQARVQGNGRGSSMHEIAATSNGKVTAVLPHGTVRSSLAELAGIDLKGFGLMMTKSNADSAVRCGAASFEAHDGTLTAQTLVIDTAPVLITGTGTVQMQSEDLDLTLHGRPKAVRLLHVRAPIVVRGTLASPTFAVDAHKSAGQAAEALALGVVLTPLAALLAFVDPGLAKDADCAGLISGVRATAAE